METVTVQRFVKGFGSRNFITIRETVATKPQSSAGRLTEVGSQKRDVVPQKLACTLQ